MAIVTKIRIIRKKRRKKKRKKEQDKIEEILFRKYTRIKGGKEQLTGA